ncbi:MAG TPA: YqgE/AlgH family protein [Caulobacteraceae bacterium]
MPQHDPVPEFLTGRLLIAMPGIGDPRFERAVLYICDHTEEHAMALAVNRPVEGLTVPDLLHRMGVESEIRLPEDFVLLGGPVEKERGFVLHTDDYVCEGSSVKLGGGVALTATREVLQALGSKTRPRKSLLALGYAGWGPGQLEREVRDNVWLVCEPDETILFDDDHDHKWSRALERIGVSAAWLSADAGRA